MENIKDIKDILTLEEHLASFQDVNPVYKHLYATWMIAKADLPNILHNIVLSFPHYSRHDASHAETILRRIESILGNERILKLPPTETWLILMSAYTHDLGMLINDQELREIWKSEEFLSYLNEIKKERSSSDLVSYVSPFFEKNFFTSLPNDWPVQVKWDVIILSADYLRRYHPERSKDMLQNPDIRKRYFQMDFSFDHFINERLIFLLGEIAVLHGKPFSDILNLAKCASGLGTSNDFIYPRRIAALLRLGDLLDMDNGRFDENAYSLYGIVPKTTEAQREKHSSLRHFLVSESRIEVTADCPDEDSFIAASDWMTWLKNEIQNLALHWNEIMPENFGTAPTLIQPNIFLKGKKIEGDSLAEFNFDNQSLFEVFEGANIYKNPFSCIRELIQNAVDASKIRLWHQLRRGEYREEIGRRKDLKNLKPWDIPNNIYKKFSITVELEYEREKKEYKIKVSDSGIGISNERLKQMSCIAKSTHENSVCKEEYELMPAWLRPTGAFGLGLQSVFRVTDALLCETLPEKEEPKKIIFRSQNKGGRISCQELMDNGSRGPGTDFSFFVRNERVTKGSFPLGGYFYNRINSLDPFENDFLKSAEDSDLYYLLDCIASDVNTTLFPITIYHNFESMKKAILVYSGQYEKINNENFLKKRKKIPDTNILFDIDWNNECIQAYDCGCDIYFKFDFKKYNHFFGQRGLNYTFKGMNVDFGRWEQGIYGIPTELLKGTIDFSGFPTKEYLTLNREHIRSNRIDEITNILQKDIHHILIYAMEMANANSNKFDDTSLIWYLFAWLYTYELESDDSDKLDKTALQECIKKRMTSSISAYQYDGGGFKSIEKILSDLYDNIWKKGYLYIFTSDNFMYGQRENVAHILDNIIKQTNKNQFPDDIIAYSYSSVRALLSLEKLHVKRVWTDSDENQTNCLYECSIDCNYELPEYSDKFLAYVNKELLKRPRIVTIANKKYANLAVKNYPSVLGFSEHSFHPLRIGSFYWKYAITPFNSDDISAITKNNREDVETYWKKIDERDDFLALVKYVKENNINENITEQSIKETYHEWYCDIIKLLSMEK